MIEDTKQDAALVAITFSTFSAAEAARITGVPDSLQRNWRNRGFLPPRPDEVRGNCRIGTAYDLFGLADLLALNLLAERLGPRGARLHALACGFGIAYQAMLAPEAYSGDARHVLSWDGEAFTRIVETKKRAQALAYAHAAGEIEADAAAEELAAFERGTGSRGWNDQAEYLRRSIFASMKVKPITERFFVLWPDGQHSWTDSLDGAFNIGRLPNAPRHWGAVLTLDLLGLAVAIVLRAKRAFVHVEIESNDDS